MIEMEVLFEDWRRRSRWRMIEEGVCVCDGDG